MRAVCCAMAALSTGSANVLMGGSGDRPSIASGRPPVNSLALEQRDDLPLPRDRDPLRREARALREGDPLLVRRQAVERRAVQRGEGLEAVEHVLLGEDLEVALDGDGRAEHPGAAAIGLLEVAQMRGRVGAEEEVGLAARRGGAQREAMLRALKDGQAVHVRAQTALEQGVAAVEKV